MNLFHIPHLQEIGNYLKTNNETIAFAESVTSGMLQFAFSNAENASYFFQGGITAYNIDQKVQHLKIDSMHAAAVNCVSEQVATEMALGVADLYSSNWSIGITGYATAVPESDGKLFAYFSICFNEEVKLTDKITPPEKEPTEVQLYYVNKIIEQFYLLIRKK